METVAEASGLLNCGMIPLHSIFVNDRTTSGNTVASKSLPFFTCSLHFLKTRCSPVTKVFRFMLLCVHIWQSKFTPCFKHFHEQPTIGISITKNAKNKNSSLDRDEKSKKNFFSWRCTQSFCQTMQRAQLSFVRQARDKDHLQFVNFRKFNFIQHRLYCEFIHEIILLFVATRSANRRFKQSLT